MDPFNLDETSSVGEDSGRGNLLAIQPWMRLDDYVSADTFEEKLAAYLKAARAQGWLNERSIAVFPE